MLLQYRHSVRHVRSASQCKSVSHLEGRAEDAGPELAVVIVVQLAEDARQHVGRQRALAVHGRRDELLRMQQHLSNHPTDHIAIKTDRLSLYHS